MFVLLVNKMYMLSLALTLFGKPKGSDILNDFWLVWLYDLGTSRSEKMLTMVDFGSFFDQNDVKENFAIKVTEG